MANLLYEFGKREFAAGWEHENEIESFELEALFSKVRDFDFFLISREDVSSLALEYAQRSLYPDHTIDCSFDEVNNSYLFYVEKREKQGVFSHA